MLSLARRGEEFKSLVDRHCADINLVYSPSLTIAVVKAFGGPFILASIFKLIQDALAFAQPQLLKRLLAFVGTYSTNKPEEPFHGSIIACGMLLVSVTQTAFLHQYFQRAFETGMRFRGALIDLM
jgi:ATP-binding cassette subfamily C (CFTR/MRP) protein 1